MPLMHIYIYIYIYIKSERERETERLRKTASLNTSVIIFLQFFNEFFVSNIILNPARAHLFAHS